ncbi:MAG: hypothetical protein AB7P12_09745 [Alphaproteobacteria bacterium]
MANIIEPTPELRADWKEWAKGRPTIVQENARKYPWWELFLLKTTGQRVSCMAYAEDGTVRVLIQPQFNSMLVHPREVFGIDPNDLEPCDIPDPATIINPTFEAESIDEMRVRVRPDLWRMTESGIAEWTGEGEPPPTPPGSRRGRATQH